MTNCAVSVSENEWEMWLEAIGEMTVVRDVEFPVSLVAGDVGAGRLAEQYGLTPSFARDLLPADVARYLSESPVLGREDVGMHLRKLIAECRTCGGRSVSIEMGLDRIRDETFEQDFEERLKLLRALIPCADQLRVSICVQVRYPKSFPGSKEWEHAGALVHEVMHPNCRLAVNLVPEEFPPNFDISTFVRSCCFRIGTLRFHHGLASGESMADDDMATWAKALRGHGFKGGIVFSPRVSTADALQAACRKIDRWARLFE
ncbi:MAG: hypothetical protein HN742_40475 [Lentisphaerae bacterium]|jgi:hypothetical protein|nr:hypothetical protein [Lentisphaerota bacterium]MBT4822628.1 hypothetical protein [Lentisphaerota bacterium]MBT5610292.1 hypothetical protein [Lentisphaerota bacterium]MBT7848211.1 hypothetical protein [Lentisphaerota bacterium]